MKRIFAFLLMLISFVAVLFSCSTAYASEAQTSARSACVMERDSKRVLYEKNAHEKLPMASTTKIMTALVVAENADLNQVVEVPDAAVGVEGSSVYLRKGEHLTVKELLYGLMLRSGNDCAVALALCVAGSLENFADLMNATAKRIGANDTNFVTPHGLPCENHYTTAYDLALISCYALQNDSVADIVSTKNAVIANEGLEYKRRIKNKNKLLFSYDGADGVKTGYTKRAGRCFVGSAVRCGMHVVCALLNCAPMFEDCAKLLNFAFDKYSMTVIIPKYKLCGAVFNEGRPRYYYCAEGLSYPLSKDEIDKVETCVTIDDSMQTIDVLLSKQLIFSQKLVTI